MRFLPAVLDGRPVFECNYSIVGFSRNLCLAIPFKAAVVVVATAGQLDKRRYVASRWVSVAAITRLYERQLHIAVFTERVGQGDTWHWLVWNRAPISQLGKCSRNQCCKMRGSTQSCCATPLIPENDVIMLKVSPPPSVTHFLYHTHISEDLFVVVNVLHKERCDWTDGLGWQANMMEA